MQHRTPEPAASRVPAALLAVFALGPDPAVGAHTFAAAVAARMIIKAPDAVMLADAGAPAVLAGVPSAVMLADACAPAVIASVPDAAFLGSRGSSCCKVVSPLREVPWLTATHCLPPIGSGPGSPSRDSPNGV